MDFIQTSNTTEGAKTLGDRLTTALKKGQKVLWLVGGGSNIPVSVAIMESIPADCTQHLSIFLIDERYGEVNHVDSNAKQLLEAGFQQKEAVFVPTLMPGFELEETRERYEQAVTTAFAHADLVVAQIGIGPDGHIAGILPHTPAADSQDMVVAYQTPSFTRISLGFSALRRVHAAYCFVFGAERKAMLERLRDEQLPLNEQPSQILKELPEAYVYNDQIGGTS